MNIGPFENLNIEFLVFNCSGNGVYPVFRPPLKNIFNLVILIYFILIVRWSKYTTLFAGQNTQQANLGELGSDLSIIDQASQQALVSKVSQARGIFWYANMFLVKLECQKANLRA